MQCMLALAHPSCTGPNTQGHLILLVQSTPGWFVKAVMPDLAEFVDKKSVRGEGGNRS